MYSAFLFLGLSAWPLLDLITDYRRSKKGGSGLNNLSLSLARTSKSLSQLSQDQNEIHTEGFLHLKQTRAEGIKTVVYNAGIACVLVLLSHLSIFND